MKKKALVRKRKLWNELNFVKNTEIFRLGVYINFNLQTYSWSITLHTRSRLLFFYILYYPLSLKKILDKLVTWDTKYQSRMYTVYDRLRLSQEMHIQFVGRGNVYQFHSLYFGTDYNSVAL
jgi:hypothetical protein